MLTHLRQLRRAALTARVSHVDGFVPCLARLLFIYVCMRKGGKVDVRCTHMDGLCYALCFRSIGWFSRTGRGTWMLRCAVLLCMYEVSTDSASKGNGFTR